MRRPLVSATDGSSRPSNTLVREWHRLACCASATSCAQSEGERLCGWVLDVASTHPMAERPEPADDQRSLT